MKVLFSPIGTTDPISTNRDGGLLHICRIYQPDKVYLYLSKEICGYHDKDDRYRKALELLGEELGWEFQVEVIRAEKMENVQIFDAFIDCFEKMLAEIREKDQPDEILVNVSSGTPAMKCSLQIISMLWQDVVAIQVATPIRESNKPQKEKGEYELDIQWECNEDRREDFEDRSMVSDAKRLLDRIKIENMHKYISVYDYEAAKMMMETLSKEPSEEFRNCLEMANARRRLDFRYMNANRKKFHLEHWFPIISDQEMKEFEYLLSMQVKMKKGQYADFIRDVTPIFYSFSEKALKKSCGLSFRDIGNKQESRRKQDSGRKQDRGAWMLDVDKLKAQGIQPDHWWIGRPVNISSNVILYIMKQKCTDQELLKLMKNIRTVEQEVRNLAAHEIVSVTRKWIKDCTGFEPEQIMDMLFDLAEYAGIAAARKNRDSYERMNEELRQMQWQASGMDLG